MIFKATFSSTGFQYYKGLKYSLNVFRCDLEHGIKLWSLLRYPVVPFKLTDIGEGIKQVTVKQCYVASLQRVSQFEDICDVESDKATVTITSRFDGVVKNVYFEEGDVIDVGSTLLDIEVDDDGSEEQVTKVADAVATTDEARDRCTGEPTDPARSPAYAEKQLTNDDEFAAKALATPAVRRIAKDYGVDVNRIKGTGKQGRVTKEDILTYLNQPGTTTDQLSQVTFGDSTAPELITSSQPITAYRKVMFKTMTASNLIPALMLAEEIDVTELEALRKRLKKRLENENVRLTLLALLVKAISLSLRQFPALNATVRGETVEYAGPQNIGVAVDTPAGLAVPNIKNVQTLSVRQIAVEVQRLQRIALDARLSLADVSGGTFTISNVGSIGGTVVKPLILPPQVAIVGVGRVRALPRFGAGDLVEKRHVINVSWAADHRVVDGATVARFSNAVKAYLEDPGLLIVDA